MTRDFAMYSRLRDYIALTLYGRFVRKEKRRGGSIGKANKKPLRGESGS